MIRTGCFSVIAVFVAAIMMFSLLIVPASAADNENMIYVSSEGNDSGDGSASAPFRTIKKAITTAATKHDGDATVVISGKIEHTDKEGSEFTFPKWSKTMKVIGDNGGKIDFKNEYGINFKFSGPIFFDDLEFSFGGYKDSQISRIVRFYNQGNRLEFGEHMVCETNSGSLYIIGRGVDSEEKGIFLRGGAVGTIWLALDTSATANDVYLTVSDNATVQTVFTGSSGTSVTVNGHVKVLDGGTITHFYAGGQRANISGDTELICSGGTVLNPSGTGNDGSVINGKAVFYICSDEASAPTNVKGFNEVRYFSAKSDGSYSANVKTKSKADSVFTAVFTEEKGSAGKLDILGSIELKAELGSTDDLLYYIIPISDRYITDENFRLLNDKKEVIDAFISGNGFITSTFASAGTKFYIAYDTSSGGSPRKTTVAENKKEIPPIPVFEDTSVTDPVTPDDPQAPDEAKGGVDVSLIIMIVLSVVILAGGVICAVSGKKNKV